jgi:16S rRNA (guanine527-N7)-methyltransferase
MREARTAGRSAPDARLRDLPRDATTLPALPSEFHATLATGLSILGVTLPPGGLEAIEAHARLLLAWNEAINLTAVTAPAAMASRHVLDSLAAVPLLAAGGAGGDGTVRVIDLGSGGGYPGLPLAVAMPAARVTLVDSVGKKAAFLEAAVGATGLGDRLRVRAARAEELATAPERWDVATARAVGAVAELVELALPLLRVGGRLVAWKRGELADEMAAAGRAAASMGGSKPVVHPIAPGIPDLEGHVLVEVRKVGSTPRGYPRDPGRRRRDPW